MLKGDRTAAMALLSVAAIIAFILFVPVKTSLVLEGTGYKKTKKEVFFKEKADMGTFFSVSFIHSVNKDSVKETYEIKEDGIYLTSCLYSSFGAGVLTELEKGQTLSHTKDGQMLVSGIDKKIENLSYIVGTVSDHIFEINGKEFSLTKLCGKNSTVKFVFKKQSIFAFLTD